MTFVFPLLLGGLALAGVPILLHLIVRQKPKTLPFPAFRFLVQQRRSNVRKLRLRQLLLLALRVLLIVALCLALARPRLFHEGLGLNRERPVAAVLVFDTSASMDYRSSDGVSRLDDAKKRGLELLDELPEGSRVAVLDSAEAATNEPWESLTSARQRIAALKVRPANAPVTGAIEQGLQRLAELARGNDEDKTARFARLLAVFSDRTAASWDGSRLAELRQRVDQVPPLFEGLLEARGQVTPLQGLLRELRSQVPASAGKDYADQSLLEALGTLQEELRGLTPDDLPPSEPLAAALRDARNLSRELLRQLGPAEADESAFLARLRNALEQLLHATGGARLLFVDVGMEQPLDLALLQVELPRDQRGPRQVFAADEPIELQALVQATGKDMPGKLVWKLGDVQEEVRFEAPAGQKTTVPLQLRPAALKLAPGPHQIEVRLEPTDDLLPLNNRRFVTFAIRQKPKVLVLSDEPGKAVDFVRALDALQYAADSRRPDAVSAEALAAYPAVYLLGVARPSEALWNKLADYVRGGGSLGVVPAGDDLNVQAYNQEAAQKILPGTIKEKTPGTPNVGSAWDWKKALTSHPFHRHFRAWQENPRTNFVRYPRGAFFYWAVQPRPKEATVLVPYADEPGRPAVLERPLDRGKVLLFTTPLDRHEPPWHNYAEEITTFYLALISESTRYLVGAGEEPTLNFTLGREEPKVTLPAGARPAFTILYGGDVFERVNPDGRTFTAESVRTPGNYVVEGRAKEKDPGVRLAGFSANLPADESDLGKVPAAEIERLFGSEAVVAIERGLKVREAMRDYWSEPVEIFPYLLIALLLLLALENLLANKFYRQDAATSGAAP